MGERLSDAYEFCDALLRREDKDRWLACLFLPKEARGHVQALYAFNLEIARVRSLVSEPILGEIRFQWWREVLAGDRAGEAEAHPVATALLDTLESRALPVAPLLGLIEARLFDLYAAPMPSLDDLEAYGRATAGALFALAAMVLDRDVGDSETARPAFAHAGIAYAVTGLLRALPWHRASGQLYLPKDLLERNGAVVEAAQAGLASPALSSTLAELRRIVREHLAKAAASGPKGRAAAALLPACLCAAYLKQMEKPGYAPFETLVELPQWRRQWLLWRAAGKIG